MNKETRQTLARASRFTSPGFDRGWAAQVHMANRPQDVLSVMLGELWVIFLAVVLIVGILADEPWIIAVTVMTGIIAIGARVWARLALEEVRYSRHVAQRYLFPGEETELTLTLENRKPIPVPWLHVYDEIPKELQALGVKTVRTERSDSYRLEDSLSLGWYERVRHRFRIRALHRGHVRIGPAQLEAGDLFGLFRARLEVRSAETIVIYPNIVPVDDINFLSARPQGDVLSRIRLAEDLSRPSGLREYVPGDPIKRIDWKVTARLGQPHVRTYDHTADQYLVIMLDAATTVNAWDGFRRPMLERGVTAAASIAARADELGYRVGLISNGVPLAGEGQMVIAPGADPRQLSVLLEALAMVRPIAIDPLSRVIGASPRAIPFGSTIIAVSSIFPDSLLIELDRLSGRGHPVMALYVGDAEPPRSGGRFQITSEGERFDVPYLEAEDRPSWDD